MTATSFTSEQRTTLLRVAADTIREALERGTSASPDPGRYDDDLGRHAATFVTLERSEQLLGCIGSLEATRPLIVDVAANALAAAFGDPRLPAVTTADYVEMSIEVSVLSELAPISAVSFEELVVEVETGRDGLVVDAGARRATFLPAVWRHFGGDIGAFVDALWRKAGLTPGEWRPGTRCFRYSTEVLVDPGPRPSVPRG